MITPLTYSARAHFKNTKRNYTYGLDNANTQVSYDIEHAILRICEREIQSVKAVEQLKQELMSVKEFSYLEIFRHVDQFAHGTINPDNLRVFFQNFDFCNDLDEEDILNWIRRYDRDCDMHLDFSDFVRSLGPYCQYTQKAKDLKGVPQSSLPGYGAASELPQNNELLDDVPAQFATAKAGS